MSGPWFAASPGLWLPAVVVAAALLGFGLAGERGLWRRGHSSGTTGARWARAIAWVAVVLGGLLMVVRPLVRSTPGGTEAVLLTEGAALAAPVAPVGDVASDPATRPLFAVGLPGSRAPSATPVADARGLWRNQPGLAGVTVRGYGLDAWDWPGFSGSVRFDPAPLPAGLARAFWPRRLALGDAFEVTGAVVAPAGAKLILEGPGGPEAEQAVDAAAAPVPFHLRGLPRTNGPQLYILRVLAPSGSEIEHEALDVVVEPARLPAILVLESAPRFETRYLKDWLTAAGARCAVRSTISKDRVRAESPAASSTGANPAPAPVTRLEGSSLAPFDVVIADPSALDALPGTERAALAAALDQGTGLIVALPRGVAIERSSLAAHPPAARTIPGLELLAARPTWPGAPAVSTLDIEARELVGDGETLVADSSGRRLAVALRRGRGTLVWSVLHDTYRYVLEGNAAAHRALWSRLLSSAARPQAQALRWRAPLGPVLVDRPLEVVLEAPPGDPRATLREAGGEPQVLVLQEDELDPSRWSATLWPRRAGWFSLEARATSAGDIDSAATPASTAEQYAAPGEAWTTWRAAERFDATRRRVGPRVEEASSGAAKLPSSRRAMPSGALFVLFLSGFAWLWIDERLRG